MDQRAVIRLFSDFLKKPCFVVTALTTALTAVQIKINLIWVVSVLIINL